MTFTELLEIEARLEKMEKESTLAERKKEKDK